MCARQSLDGKEDDDGHIDRSIRRYLDSVVVRELGRCVGTGHMHHAL